MKTDIISRLTAYYHLYKKLDHIGGLEVDGDLFEELIGIEEVILKKFGLPLSNKNKTILWKLVNKTKLSEKNLQQTLEHLQAAAERFLHSPVQSDLEQLMAAKKQNRSAFDILPELGQPTHEYTIFLYDVILDFASPEDVLAELSALKRLDCYGEAASLKNQFPRTFRKTKVYKQLSPYLKFFDNYLDPSNFDLLISLNNEDDESMPHPLEMARVVSFKDLDEHNLSRQDADLFSIARPEPVDFEPDYIILSDLIEIEEIIFSEDSAVTVTGQLYECCKPSPITLGFDFDTLAALIREYGSQGKSVLNYFNKSRQQNLIDVPVVISLKDKTGSTLELRQHYFKVYKPLTLGANGKPEIMKEAFYIVDEVIDKRRYDQQQVMFMRSGLNGTFHHISQHYYFYLNHRHDGLSEDEARKKAELQDWVRFEISRMLYLLEKHGGRAEMK
ncbi:hypothetical protein H8S95_01785 [Pontibacter sp. KCTC 32443]|uniref:hypothetical protein n=1 Tax=Pontibacter TaxID=323449 RepID=UPI00164E9C52|nr:MULTISPECIES: hypothetical protein [Pontibacter]MBC5772780.1 hypothetical protein [Pontibacter sp. KCTC 32443]